MSGISTTSVDSRVSSRVHLRLTLQHGNAPAVCRQYDLLDGELLLGSADICDLQVADAGVPPIHSILHAEGSGLLLESLVSTPPLRINGRTLEAGRLRTGDRIELGSCALTVTAVEERNAVLSNPDGADLTSWTASELVEAIEREHALIERFETGRRAGVETLLHALGERRATPNDDDQWVALIERVCVQLDVFTRELDGRSTKLCRREAAFAEQAAALSQSQQKLVERLEALARQVHDLRGQRLAHKKVA